MLCNKVSWSGLGFRIKYKEPLYSFIYTLKSNVPCEKIPAYSSDISLPVNNSFITSVQLLKTYLFSQ